MTRKVIVIAGIATIVVGIFTAGWFASSYQTKRNRQAAEKSAVGFVEAVVNGKNQEAYNAASDGLRSDQTLDEFSKSLGDIKSANPELDAVATLQSSNSYLVAQRVNNLPKTASGSTSGVFKMIVEKNSGKWRVSSVTIE